MDLAFYKYEGAGNDFIFFDDRQATFPDKETGFVKFLCDRRFGIGADGLILLELHEGADFRMKYYNSDGIEASMCGNGGRCIAAFARDLGIIRDTAVFVAADGDHMAEFTRGSNVRLKMKDVSAIETGTDYYYLDTGSPHYVMFMPLVSGVDVFTEGRKIRYGDRFKEKGTNVDFVEDSGDTVFVRTYERGVENETLACGTGVVASVLCTAIRRNIKDTKFSVPVKVMGGDLLVTAHRHDHSFTEIWLEGPANFVFRGLIPVPDKYDHPGHNK